MEQTVYVDLYFLINFSMDFLGLFLAAKLLSYRVHVLRGVLAAVFGAVYACVALLFIPSGTLGLLLDICACAVMAFIAIGQKRNLRQVGAYALVYTAVSILLGGFMTALFSLFNKLGLNKLSGEGEVSDGISVWLFVLLAAISGVLSFLGGRVFKRKSSRKYGRVRVCYNKRSVTFRALCDSGNLLREPISAKPCIVADARLMREIFSPNAVELIKGGRIYELDIKDAERIRIIPAATVNGDGLLYALRADSVSIDMGKGWCDVDVYVAFSNLELSDEGARALIPSELALGAP